MMHPKWTDAWAKRQADLRARIAGGDSLHTWESLVRLVVGVLSEPGENEHTHAVSLGGYSGVLVAVVGEEYGTGAWISVIHYGSCSGCDALERALTIDGDGRTDALMTLALHIVQRMRWVD